MIKIKLKIKSKRYQFQMVTNYDKILMLKSVFLYP